MKQRVFCGVVALTLLGGCSSAGLNTAPPPALNESDFASRETSLSPFLSNDSSVLPDGVRKLRSGPNAGFFSADSSKAGGAYKVFVSDPENQVVDIFNATGELIAAIPGFGVPQGLAVDRVGNLYVADTTGYIFVYASARGYKGRPKEVLGSAYLPEGVAVDRVGNVGVTNIVSRVKGASGSVSFFAPNQKFPTSTISSGAFARIFFGAFDIAGNFFIDGEDANRATVIGEIVGGFNGTEITVLSTTNSIGIPGGILVNSKGHVVIDDQRAGAAYTYFLKGTKLIAIATTQLTGTIDPVGIALAPNGTDIYAADAVNSAAYEFPYLTGGSPLQTIGIPGSQPIGIAVYASPNP